MNMPQMPLAARNIEKGVPLKNVIGRAAVEQLARNLELSSRCFDPEEFIQVVMQKLDSLELMERGQWVAEVMRHFLPPLYEDAVQILIQSMTPARQDAVDLGGTSTFFYLPYSCFISSYGLSIRENGGVDPFECSMNALLELTTRFTSEFAIRPFLIEQEQRTFDRIHGWLSDPNPHVRRLCSEGTRPLLPWGRRLPAMLETPEKTLHILESLKNDKELYVRRSVANHLGDLAKSHPRWVFGLCQQWLEEGASRELKWVIRHAVRYWAKKDDPHAIELRSNAR